jgi:hypothetical protein
MKKIFIIIVSIMLIFSFCACGADNDHGPDISTEDLDVSSEDFNIPSEDSDIPEFEDEEEFEASDEVAGEYSSRDDYDGAFLLG